MDGLTNRHLADVPALVRQAADGDTTAAASLKEPAFLTALDDFLAAITRDGSSNSLPLEFRSVVTTHFKPTTPRLDVTRNIVAEWTERPETFFDLPDGDPPYQLYYGLTSLSHHGLQPVDAARRRVYLVLFYDLREAFRSRFGNTKKDPLAIYLSGLYKALGVEEVKKNCADWANRGAKYKTLAAKSVGDGALLVPTSIGRSTLEDRMTVSVDNDAASSTAKKFTEDVDDRAIQWNCNAAAKKLFTYYFDGWKEWLENLGWQPPQEALGYTLSRAQGTSRKRRKYGTTTLRTWRIPAHDIGFAATIDVSDRDSQGGISGTSIDALGPAWPAPSMCPGPTSTLTEMSEASWSHIRPSQFQLAHTTLPLPPSHCDPYVSPLNPEHIRDSGPFDIEVWANGAIYTSTLGTMLPSGGDTAELGIS